MDDVISRRVAIDAMETIGYIATMPDGDKCIRESAVKYTLSMLPSAQPETHEERKETHVCDCIDRQAAIEAMSESLKRVFPEHRQIAEKCLNVLPSAQSEIVRCKDCRWKNKHFCNRAVELFIHDEDFCSWAERREG